jgi:hypothetical protein
LGHLFRFIERVDGQRDDVGIFLFELFEMSLEIGYLPNAIGSPQAAVENDHGILAFQIRGYVQCAAIGGPDGIVGKWISRIELFGH